MKPNKYFINFFKDFFGFFVRQLSKQVSNPPFDF